MARTPQLDGVVAVVTGASRGVGRGIVDALAGYGARVYATGRTISDADGARYTAIRCDHTSDADTERAFANVLARERRIDLLVNAAWGGYERMVEDGRFTWPAPFWEQPMWRWDAMFGAGVRAAFACSRIAAARMVEQRSGLIVNLSYWAAQKYLANAIYGASKCATDRLTADMAHELDSHGVTVVSMYPGLVRTELVMQAAGAFDLSNSESPQFTGRAIAYLYDDPARHATTGRVVVAAAYARDAGFTDVDGRRPVPLTSNDA